MHLALMLPARGYVPVFVRAADFNGDIDVLHIEEVPVPVPGKTQALVRVRAAGINPGEAVIRTGRWRSCSRRRSRPGRAATWRITTIR